MSVLTAEENDWVFDYVMNVLRSPAWEVPVLCFLDEHCAVFDAEDENKFVHSELHEQFRELVERVLSDNLAEIGLSAADFADVCERSRGSGGDYDASMDVVNQILAMDDFLTFKKLMVKRNLELELEAIRALRDEVADDATADAAARDMEAHLMELSVLYKQEEMEQAELEAALAMSLSVQEEELRLASAASKAAEDKFADPTAAVALSPEEAHRQLRESKKKAEEICKKNKEALVENRSKQREWQQAAEISEAELRRREEYLRKQRDLLVEKKRKEREAQLKEFRQETKQTPPEPVSVSMLVAAVQYFKSGCSCALTGCACMCVDPAARTARREDPELDT